LIFECKIAADPKPDLFWTRDDVSIQDSGRYLIYCDPLPNNAFVACLEIDDVNATDAGKYKISAKNQLGESNAHIQLNLDSMFIISSYQINLFFIRSRSRWWWSTSIYSSTTNTYV
jgi:hypothetical protein